jgi:hypothetical protein
LRRVVLTKHEKQGHIYSIGMSSKKSKSKPSQEPKSPRKLNKKALIALLIVAVPSTILLTPAVYYGSFTLRVARIMLDETTAAGQTIVSISGITANVEARSVYDYTYSIETGGIFRTTVTSTTTAGSAVITVKISVAVPSLQTVSSTTTINGGIGTRSLTIYLGPNEGVRASGLYIATVTITALVNPLNGPPQNGSKQYPSLLFFV